MILAIEFVNHSILSTFFYLIPKRDFDNRIWYERLLHSATATFAMTTFNERDILKYVCKVRGKYFGLVDHRGTSQTCPNCRAEVRKTLANRFHACQECGYGVDYFVDRDLASAQEICNRGIETTTLGLRGKETVCQVEVSEVMSLDNWRRGGSAVLGSHSGLGVSPSRGSGVVSPMSDCRGLPLWAEISRRESGSPNHNF